MDIQQAKPKAGHPPYTAHDDKTLYIVWFDKRQVSLITTAHNNYFQEESEVKKT